MHADRRTRVYEVYIVPVSTTWGYLIEIGRWRIVTIIDIKVVIQETQLGFVIVLDFCRTCSGNDEIQIQAVE